MRKKEKKLSADVIEVEGVVVAALPKLEYTVEIDFKGIKHSLTCHVSGKMKTRYIELEKGDKVILKISLYDIDRGIITKRLTKRFNPNFVQTNTVTPEAAPVAA